MTAANLYIHLFKTTVSDFTDYFIIFTFSKHALYSEDKLKHLVGMFSFGEKLKALVKGGIYEKCRVRVIFTF